MSVYEIFTLTGGIGLFLYGMKIMSSGLKNACGDNLRVILEKATHNKLIAVLAGIAVTIFIQSSSATDVMVIGFVTSGLMNLSQAIGVIMGANIGTTITAQITAFNIGAYAPFILFLGAVMNLFLKNKTLQEVGNVILGFGMLFVGITMMKSAIIPLSETRAFISFISSLSNPIITVIFGVLFTALLQSSSSATVIFQAFAMQGIITYNTTVYLIIGAAIGSVTPNLLAGLTANKAGKRSAVLNLLFNLIRAVLIMILITVFPQILTFIQNLSPGNIARQIANTHTIFAITAVLLLLPFTDFIVKMAEKLIPYTEEENRKAADQRLVYLTQTANVPAAIVLDQAHREISRMGEISINNLILSLECFFNKDDTKRQLVEENEQTVDFLAQAIVAKLVELRSLNMSPRNLHRFYRMIQVVDDIERISDHAENIIEYEEKLSSGSAVISDIGKEDLHRLAEATSQSMKVALAVFESENEDRLDEAKRLEDNVDTIHDEIVQNHIDRLMKDTCDPQGGVIFTNMCTDLERCSDHALNIATALTGTVE